MNPNYPDDYCAETDPANMPDESTPTNGEPETIIAELTGKPIRLLNPARMLQTGDMLTNRVGQKIFEVVAFHPKGVKIRVGPSDILETWTWETVYRFYEDAVTPPATA